MLPRQIPFLLLSFLALFATGCAEVTVNSPDSDTVYTEPPTEFSVSWSNDILGNGFKAFLNGENITADFTQENSTATVPGADLADFLKHGENIFTVSSPATRIVSFTMDLEGPTVHITGTEEVGGNLEVTGYLDDPSPVVSLDYEDDNGNSGSITVTDNAFSATIPDNDPTSITFTALDAVGQTSETTFLRTDAGLVQNTIGMRINSSALEFASAVAPDILSEVDLIALIAGDGEPVFDFSALFVTFEFFIDPDPDGAGVGDPSLDVTHLNLSASGSADLRVDMTLENAYIPTRACVDPPLLPAICVYVVLTADELSVSDVDLDVGAGTGDQFGQIVVNDASIGDLNVTDAGLITFFFGLPIDSSVLDFLNVTDLLVNLLSGLISDLISGPITGAIQEMLADLPLNFDIELDVGNGIRVVNAVGHFDEIGRENDSLLIKLGAGLTTSTPADVPEPLGIRYYGEAPNPGQQAQSGTAYDFGFALSATFMNQLLDTIYRAGMLNLTIDMAEGTQGFAATRVTIDPAAPPFVSVINNALGMGSLSLHDFSMRVETKASAEAEYELLFAATINMTAPFDLIEGEENTLGVDISTLVNIDVVSVDEEGSVPVSTSMVDTLVTLAAPFIIPTLSEVMSNIELPVILGLSVNVQEIWAEPAGGTFMVAGDLLTVEEMAALEEE